MAKASSEPARARDSNRPLRREPPHGLRRTPRRATRGTQRVLLIFLGTSAKAFELLFLDFHISRFSVDFFPVDFRGLSTTSVDFRWYWTYLFKDSHLGAGISGAVWLVLSCSPGLPKPLRGRGKQQHPGVISLPSPSPAMCLCKLC